MTTNILFASEHTKNSLPNLKWQEKAWVTRDGKNTVWFALSDSVPAGFVADDRNNWRVDADEAAAYFTPDVIAGWHSQDRAVGTIARRPRIVHATARELTIHEKLAKLAPPQPIIPQPARAPEIPEAFLTRRKGLDIAYNRALDAADADCKNAEDAAARVLKEKFSAKMTLKGSDKIAVSKPKAKHLDAYNVAIADARSTRNLALGKALNEWRTAVRALEDEYGQRHGPLVALPGQKITGCIVRPLKPRPFIAAS